MKRPLLAVLVVLIGLSAYLLLWPVPIAPAVYVPSDNPGMTGVFAPNELLSGAKHITPGIGVGPEDVTKGPDGLFYTGLEDGRIIRFQPDGSSPETFVSTGGRPLGMQFNAHGNLVVADGGRGLLSIAPDGTITVLTDNLNGKRFIFVDDLDIAADGTVWFSDASQRFSGNDYVLDGWETRPTGRLLSYDPRTRKTTVHMESLMFANGVALGPEEQYVLVNETIGSRIWRLWLAGSRAGEREVFLELPGYPDNLSHNGRDFFWVALHTPRNNRAERLWSTTLLRKVIFRTPLRLLTDPARLHGWVIGVNAEGEVVQNLQDADGGYNSITSVNEFDNMLYLGSNKMSSVGRYELPLIGE